MTTGLPAARRIRNLLGPWLAVVLLFSFGAGAAGCASDRPGSAGAGPTGSHAGATHMPGQMDAERLAAWDARPDFVRAADARTSSAYAYALEYPDVVQWLPCYCGCVGMGHRSNMDCFLKPREDRAPIAFEEHGSFCGVCVDTALMAKRMLAEGKSLLQVRMAVDQEFGDLAPGTLTDLPPG